MLQSPEQHVFWEFLVQNKVFYLSKRHKQVAKLSSAGIGYSALHGVNPNSKKKNVRQRNYVMSKKRDYYNKSKYKLYNSKLLVLEDCMPTIFWQKMM